MPNIKDLFDKQGAPYKVLSSKSIDNLTSSKDVESFGFIDATQKEKDRWLPELDYSQPKSFAKYGLAEKYYEDSITRIFRMYPYDGSRKEKVEWHNSSSYLDNFIFEKEYPRTNGYLNFNISPGTLSSFLNSSTRENYQSGSTGQYIYIKGGPHKAQAADTVDDYGTKDFKSLSSHTSYTSKLANVYDAEKSRESNLTINGETGNTIEFWFKPATTNDNQGIFDLWNGNGSSETLLESGSYGRFLFDFRIHAAAFTPIDGSYMHLTYMSGTAGVRSMPVLANYNPLGRWTHVALTVKNSGLSSGDDGLEVKTYINGDLYESLLTGTAVSEVTGALNANIGCYRYYPDKAVEALAMAESTPITDFNGYSFYTGSMDEFRFWKTARTGRDVKRNWFAQVYGGSNSDDANTDLGVYYKFNEGITQTASFDQTVLDYSGRISNGAISNYISATRATGSAMVESETVESEFKDPIIYSFHPDVLSYLSAKRDQGYEYDQSNAASIMDTFPDWIIDEDVVDGGGHLKNIVQTISQYFDSLQLQLDALNTLKNIEYTKYNVLDAKNIQILGTTGTPIRPWTPHIHQVIAESPYHL